MSGAAARYPLPPPANLLAEARRLTGIEREDVEARVPLEVLVRSLDEQGGLHAQGARAMHERLVRILCNRLRMQRDWAAHPEIAAERIVRPVFICGMARTGSTKTQKLLAASGDFDWLPYWQVLNPSLRSGERGESPQWRIDDTEAFVRWFDAMSPQTRAGHAFETQEPEEESFILEHSLRTPTFMGWAPMPGYLGWLLTQDLRAQFVHLRDTLRYLQWQGRTRPGRPWVLKCPLYSGLEPLLLEVFPDARLVMTHRHPRITIPSGLRLLECFYAPYTSVGPNVAEFVAGQAAAISGHLAFRAAAPAGTFLDIDFDALVRDVAHEIGRIYDFCGRELARASCERMLAWEADNPQHKRGRHDYALARYGLTDEIIEQHFAAYTGFLHERFAT